MRPAAVNSDAIYVDEDVYRFLATDAVPVYLRETRDDDMWAPLAFDPTLDGVVP